MRSLWGFGLDSTCPEMRWYPRGVESLFILKFSLFIFIFANSQKSKYKLNHRPTPIIIASYPYIRLYPSQTAARKSHKRFVLGRNIGLAVFSARQTAKQAPPIHPLFPLLLLSLFFFLYFQSLFFVEKSPPPQH